MKTELLGFRLDVNHTKAIYHFLSVSMNLFTKSYSNSLIV
jgi:hypothetical protein